MPPAPDTLGEEGWAFDGWLPVPPSTVDGDAVYVAQWIYDEDGVLIEPEDGEVPLGAADSSTASTVEYIGEPKLREQRNKDTLQILKDMGIPIFNIGGVEIPLTAPHWADVWALLNLVLCVAGAIIAVITIVRILMMDTRERDGVNEPPIAVENRIEPLIAVEKWAGLTTALENENEPPIATVNRIEPPIAKEDRKNSPGKLRAGMLAATVVLAAAGVAVFLFTQNMDNLMVLIDIWSIVHAAIFVLELIAASRTLKRIHRADNN
jgi:hypothetical protein